MTRKEQIIEILNNHKIIDAKRDNILVLYAKDVEIGFIADEILALPLDVPGDDEIEIKYSTSLPVLCCLHDIPIRFDAGQGEYLSIMRDNNDLKQRGAKWMRSEILKRNTP